MATVQESNTFQRSNDEKGDFIQDDAIRIDGHVITEIDRIEKHEPEEDEEYGTVKMHIKDPYNAGPWSYDMREVLSGDSSCWIVALAKERGYRVSNLDELEGEMVYIKDKSHEDCWTMFKEHPKDKFDSMAIDKRLINDDHGQIVAESKDTGSVFPEDSTSQLEVDCLEYRKLDDYLICEIEKMVEIESELGGNSVRIVVDTPYGGKIWDFRKPYEWSEENPLVKLADSRGYAKINFTSLVGDEVLVKREDGAWSLDTRSVSKYRKDDKEEDRFNILPF